MCNVFPSMQAYNLSKISFGMVKAFVLTIQESGFTLMGLYPWLWDMACTLTLRLGYEPSDNEIIVSLVFLGLTTAQDTVLSLPWSLYSTFVVEQKHGFNKTTPMLFITDLLTTLALTVVIGAPVMTMLLKIIKWGGEYFYIYVWGFLLVFSIFFLTIFPIFIQPL